MNKQEEIKRIRVIIAERIKTLRNAAGLTQEKLSEAAQLGPEYISRLETADRTPSLDALVSISAAMGVDVVDLVGRPKEGKRAERAARIEAILNGLSDKDAGFFEDELANWASHLRRR